MCNHMGERIKKGWVGRRGRGSQHRCNHMGGGGLRNGGVRRRGRGWTGGREGEREREGKRTKKGGG